MTWWGIPKVLWSARAELILGAEHYLGKTRFGSLIGLVISGFQAILKALRNRFGKKAESPSQEGDTR